MSDKVGAALGAFVFIASIVLVWLASLGFYDVTGDKLVIYPLAVVFVCFGVLGVAAGVHMIRASL